MEAFLLRFESLVPDGRLIDLFLLVVMTGEAEVLGTLCGKEKLVIRAVGIVAAHTSLLHRSMGKFLSLELITLVRMTIVADLVPLGLEQLGEIALMHRMTGAAAAGGNGSVHKLPANNGALVTEEAEFGPGSPELVLVGRLVRVVAPGAVAVFYGGMDVLLGSQVFMAFAAELSHIGDLPELMLAFEDMTKCAVAGGDGAVHELLLPHPVMAITCHARRFLVATVSIRHSRLPVTGLDQKKGTHRQQERHGINKPPYV